MSPNDERGNWTPSKAIPGTKQGLVRHVAKAEFVPGNYLTNTTFLFMSFLKEQGKKMPQH